MRTAYSVVRSPGIGYRVSGIESRTPRPKPRDPSPGTQGPRPERRLLRLVLAALSVLVSLLIAEAGFRVFWVKRWTVSAGIEDPHYHHRLKPSTTYHYTSKEFDVHITTNRFGLRGKEPSAIVSRDTVRVLMLGDSFTFGFPVRDEETFAYLTGEHLKERGFPVEVVNAGVSSYSPTLHYISLRDDFLEFHPDAVILWYDWGDLRDDYWYQKNLIFDEDGRILRCDPQYTYGRFSRWEWIQNRSALAKYIHTKGVRTFQKIRILGLAGYLRAKLAGETAKVAIARLKAREEGREAVHAVLDNDRLLLLRDGGTAESLKAYWAVSEKYILMIRDLLHEHGIPLLIGIYPYGVNVGPDEWSEGRTSFGFEKGKVYEARGALELFEDFSRRSGIPLINSFEGMRRAGQTEALFYAWDGHLNPAGHRALAQCVAGDPVLLNVLEAAFKKKAPDRPGPF